MKEIKDLIFKLKHGFWRSDLWNLDYTIAKFVYPRLKYFVEQGTVGSCVTNLKFLKQCGLKPFKKDNKGDYIHKNWKLVLNEILFAFDYFANDKELDEMSKIKDGDYTKYWKIEQRVQNGFKLFGEYFKGLWD